MHTQNKWIFLNEYITANKGLSQCYNPVVPTVDAPKKSCTYGRELLAEMFKFRRGKN
jgi:hypothetical protein